MSHHLIFEGPELAGKSWLMSRIYDFLEIGYNCNQKILDGCHWFNSDVGIFGGEHGKFCVEKYVEMLKELNDKNVLFEKLHISDIVYNKMHRHVEIDYAEVEEKLIKLNSKIILCTFAEDVNLIKKRIKDRLILYPHYERILQDPKWYISQQREYIKEIKKTKLPYLIVDLTEIPNKKDKEILEWIGE